jgi:hypothetical protein
MRKVGLLTTSRTSKQWATAGESVASDVAMWERLLRSARLGDWLFNIKRSCWFVVPVGVGIVAAPSYIPSLAQLGMLFAIFGGAFLTVYSVQCIRCNHINYYTGKLLKSDLSLHMRSVILAAFIKVGPAGVCSGDRYFGTHNSLISAYEQMFGIIHGPYKIKYEHFIVPRRTKRGVLANDIETISMHGEYGEEVVRAAALYEYNLASTLHTGALAIKELSEFEDGVQLLAEYCAKSMLNDDGTLCGEPATLVDVVRLVKLVLGGVGATHK